MAAFHQCITKGHCPYVEVGDPSIVDNIDVLSLQYIGLKTKEGDCICINSDGERFVIPEEWVLAFACELCPVNPLLL